LGGVDCQTILPNTAKVLVHSTMLTVNKLFWRTNLHR